MKNEEKITAEKNLNSSKDAVLTTKSEENFDVASEKKLATLEDEGWKNIYIQVSDENPRSERATLTWR